MDSGLHPLTGKRILITGAGGFLGSALVGQLREVDCTLIRLGRRPMPTCNGRSRIEDIQSDLEHPDWHRPIVGPLDIVVHLAAQTSAAVAKADPGRDARINVTPLQDIVTRFGDRHHPPSIVMAGTVTQAGVDHANPLSEAATDCPVTVYDRHKLLAETHLKEASVEGFVNGVTLRFSNIYGPGPSVDPADRGVMNQMIRRAYSGKTLTVFGTGRQIRDYLYVSDAVAALTSAMIHASSLAGRFFVIGSGIGTSIGEAFRTVGARAAQRTGRSVAVTHLPATGGIGGIDNRDCWVDARSFRAATGWVARFSLQEGIDKTLDWMAATKAVDS